MNTTVLNNKALANAECLLNNNLILLKNFLSTEHSSALLETFPTEGFTSYQFDKDEPNIDLPASSSVITLDADDNESFKRYKLAPCWQALVKALSSMENLQNLGEICNIDLSHCKLRFNLVEHRAQDYISAHYDTMPGKVLTLLIYLNPNWDKENGGLLNCLKDQEDHQIIESFSPLINQQILLKSGKTILHEVTPVKSGATRRSIVVEFIH